MGEYEVEQSAAALSILNQDQASSCPAAASLGASPGALRLLCCGCVLQLPRVSLCQYLRDGDSLIGSAAAWTADASSYFLKQVMCLVAAVCTTHAFSYILALGVLDVLMRLGHCVGV